jgi:hypothetical protein
MARATDGTMAKNRAMQLVLPRNASLEHQLVVLAVGPLLEVLTSFKLGALAYIHKLLQRR